MQDKSTSCKADKKKRWSTKRESKMRDDINEEKLELVGSSGVWCGCRIQGEQVIKMMRLGRIKKKKS